jgi:chorismate dehydratase
MGGQSLKLGTVPYLNAKPLTIALENRADVDLCSAPPSRLARMLAAGELDAALVSAYALFQHPGARHVPGVGIASRGPVKSIRLYCRRPPEVVNRVGLDEWSLSASHMARVLIKLKWRREPEFIAVDPERPPRDDESLDAFLLIGDNALREPGGDFHVIDLGEVWTDYTGLPFLYAVWMFRPGVGDAAAARLLCEAKEEGMRRIEEIIAWGVRELPYIDEPTARDYLTNCIRYDVGTEEEEGLHLYYEYLTEEGLAPFYWEAIPMPLEEERHTTS